MEKHGSAQNYIGQRLEVNFGMGQSPEQVQIIPGLSIARFLDFSEETSVRVSFTHSGFVFHITGYAGIHLDYNIIGNFPIYRIFSEVSPCFTISNFEGDGGFFPSVVSSDDDTEISVIYTFKNSIVFVSGSEDCTPPIFWMNSFGAEFFVFDHASPGFAKGLKKLYLNESERFSEVWHAAKRHGHSARIAKTLGIKPMDIEVSIRGTEIASFI